MTTTEEIDETIEEPMEAVPEEMPEPAPLDPLGEGYAPESMNLVPRLSEQEEKDLIEECIQDYEGDLDSLSEWKTKRDQLLRLFLGMMPPAEDGSIHAQIHFPIISTAIQRSHSRIYDQQFPSNGEYWGAKPTDALDLERAVRIAKHMNWQTEHKMPEYVPNHDVLIQQWFLYGSAFSYMYWDSVKNAPCHEACRTDDIVISYTTWDTDPSMANVPRITRILRKQKHELYQLSDSGYYSNIDKIYEETDGKIVVKGGSADKDDSDQPTRETIDRASGAEKPEDDKGAPRKLIEQHRWYTLPGEIRDRPVIVTIDLASRTLLCLKIREDEDPEDRARYNREKAASKAAYDLAMAQYEMSMQAYLAGVQQMMTQTPAPMPGEQTMTAPPIPGETTSTGPALEMPQPPPPPPEPRQPKMVPVNFFTHFVCIPNPEGFYGLGLGFMLEGHNIMADSLGSQVVTAGVLSNTKTFIFSRQNKLSRGEFKIEPGKGIESDLMPADLKNGIHILDFPGPEPALGQLIKDQIEQAEGLSGANEILSGEVGGSNETATTTQIRISQALASLQIQSKRYTRARTVEGRKLARLNSVHLDDVEYFTVVDPFKQVPKPQDPMNPMAPPEMQLQPVAEPVQIGRMDYLQDVDITVTADPRMASQPQRVQEAIQAYQLFSQTPPFNMNPAFMSALAKNILVAMDRPELVAALGMAPMPMMPQQGGPPQKGGGEKKEGEGNGKPKPEAPETVPNSGAPQNAPFMSQAQ